MLRPLAVLIVSLILSGCAGVPAPQAAHACRLGEAMVETQLFFGMSKPKGGTVSEREWQAFVAAEVAPRFPEGFSVLTGAGFWRDAATAKTISEKSKVVVRMHADGAGADAAIGAIVAAYKTRFQQDAVLRVDRPVCAQF
jgi:Protein of unknown function (DUF3574)